MTATGRLDVLTGATLLPLAGSAEFPVRMWVLGADAARLQALAPARDVQVISLGQPAAHAARVTPPRQGTEPVVKSLPHATARKAPTVVECGSLRVGAGARAVIAGPCSVESAEQVMRIARHVASCGATALRGGIFKPRTNPYAFQGHGLEALDWLVAAGRETGLPVVTEVMAADDVKRGGGEGGRGADRRAQHAELRPACARSGARPAGAAQARHRRDRRRVAAARPSTSWRPASRG